MDNPPWTYINLIPACKHCKNPLTENDDDFQFVEEEIDENGEINQAVYYTDGKLNTLEQTIEDMELTCEACCIEIPKKLFEKGLCFMCYDDPPLFEENPGTIVIEEGKFLSCESCKGMWVDI
jgi:hypothetical protein